ncbi:type II secretion system protein GspD [Vulcanococcus limneticus]|uniref:type II secretion system protein GspD n=1 Tax=Vulcanococcus limneticus TaxID=2170428 RepID=UPI00398BD0DF
MKRLGLADTLWCGAATLALVVAPPLELVALAQAQIRQDGLQLRVKRLPDAIELVIQDAGAGSALEQQRSGTIWTGELRTERERGLKAGPQSLAMPDAGMERITFDGTGRLFQLKVTPQMGRSLGPPIISSDGKDLTVRFPAAPLPVSQTFRPNLTQPTALPTPAYVPPLRPRAVAPPLGDMAVGSMTIRNRGYINLSGPPVTLTTRGANARDVLMVLAQMGNYGFAYEDNFLQGALTDPQGSKDILCGVPVQPFKTTRENEDQFQGPNRAFVPCPVTASFRGESFTRAFNFVLMTSGLKARTDGNTILVGPNVLQKPMGPQASKVYRLNQSSPDSAADYLANLGAAVTKTFTETITATTGVPLAGASTSNPQTTRTSTKIKVEEYQANSGPLLGLRATTDTRLSTITLVGEPGLVATAEQYLRQLDLRQRQVALSVKILDVTLNNATDIDNSFALRFGNNFIVNDGGKLLAAFGRNLPAREADFAASRETISTSSSNASGSRRESDLSNSTGFDNSLTANFDNSRSLSQSQIEAINANLARTTGTEIRQFEEKTFVPNPNASAPDQLPFIEVTNSVFRVVPTGNTKQAFSSDLVTRIEEIIANSTGQNVRLNRTATGSIIDGQGRTSSSSRAQAANASGIRRVNPGLNYPDNQFFNFLQAQIVSNNTKVLASPTLIIQEGGTQLADKDIDQRRISADGQVGRSRSNEAYVRVGTQLVTSYEVKQDALGNNFCQPIFGNAGLTFGARVDKIDDNGFVTFSLSPEISAEVGQQSAGTCGNISLINDRILDTGQVRVRDGQTLILTGVISDTDRQEVSKWPILGDLPFIGQFFRKTGGSRTKSELVIMVTPRIVNDEQGGTYGYGYTPSTQDARRLIYSSGQ